MSHSSDPLKSKAKQPACKSAQSKVPGQIPNRIDREFSNLMEFINGRSLAQMQEDIKHNLRYFESKDKPNYDAIINYYNKYKLWGAIHPDTGEFEMVENRAQALVEHQQDFEWLYERLGDYRSKRVLLSILSYWLSSDYHRIAQIMDKYYHQYFDFDLIQCDENEVFVDIGAYIGDTMVDYVKMYGTGCYKRIYCYEIIPANVAYIQKNMELCALKDVVVCNRGASEKSGILYLSDDAVSSIGMLSENGAIEIATVAIDEDIAEPVTFIKMDIEGAEEDALLGCRRKIAENHPKLALAAYHNHKDLWKLARIIHETDPTYRFYLRYYGGALLPTEYVLYAV